MPVRNSHNDNSLPSLDPPEGLPIKTMKEFEEFEKDVAKQKLFKAYMITWGASDIKTGTKQFLKDAIDEALTPHFLWVKGEDKNVQDDENQENNDTQNPKNSSPKGKPLYKTNTSKLIYSALLTAHPNLTVEAYSKAMSAALRAAKQRYRDRGRRNELRAGIRRNDRRTNLQDMQGFLENTIDN